MKLRFLFLLPLLLLAGCTFGPILTGQIDNPVTAQRALLLHSSFYAGVAVAAGEYANLARCPAPSPCSDQRIVNQLRTYVNGAEATLVQLDQWALGNTRLNGPALFQAAVIAITTAQNFASTNGLRFQPAQGT